MNTTAVQEKEIAILGFGNPVREDDGVGVYVLQQLQERMANHPEVELYDMGTSAFEVLFRLKGKRQIILVDAVLQSGEPVGTLFKLPADQIEAQIQDDPLVFLHGLKWDQALSYARKMLGDDFPGQITVYLLAIESTRFNLGMTDAARAGADRLVQLLLEAFPVA